MAGDEEEPRTRAAQESGTDGERAAADGGESARLAAVAAALGPQVPAIAREVVGAYARASPLYTDDGLMLEHLHLIAAGTMRTLLRTVLQALVRPGPPDHAVLSFIADRAADRADEGVPLSEYLRACHLLTEALDRRLVAALADRPAELQTALHRAREIQSAAERAAAVAFERRYREMLDDADGEPPRVVAALSEGRVDAAIGLARRPLPQHPVAVVLAFGPRPHRSAPNPAGARLSERRTVRRARAAIDRCLPGTWLTDLSAHGGTAVTEADASDSAALQRLVGDLEDVLRRPVSAAAEPAADVGDTARALRVAREVLRVAPHPGRVTRAADVALDLHLGQESDGLGLLRESMSALEERPDEAATVRAYLECDMDRRATARRLGVHPNTVDNRLARVRRLTGADPSTARGLVAFAAVLWNAAPRGSVPEK